MKWNQDVGHLPILTSECPGWVCYAEKTIGEEAFPFMSKVKSPQQLCGKLVKTNYGNSKFVSIMPCYDKKLEAVRPMLPDGRMEVDTVLATHELIELLKKKDLASVD